MSQSVYDKEFHFNILYKVNLYTHDISTNYKLKVHHIHLSHYVNIN
jgi:hypothetical protein